MNNSEQGVLDAKMPDIASVWIAGGRLAESQVLAGSRCFFLDLQPLVQTQTLASVAPESRESRSSLAINILSYLFKHIDISSVGA
jgi:hypothetical protein